MWMKGRTHGGVIAPSPSSVSVTHTEWLHKEERLIFQHARPFKTPDYPTYQNNFKSGWIDFSNARKRRNAAGVISGLVHITSTWPGRVCGGVFVPESELYTTGKATVMLLAPCVTWRTECCRNVNSVHTPSKVSLQNTELSQDGRFYSLNLLVVIMSWLISVCMNN